jgi:hypothetical protein
VHVVVDFRCRPPSVELSEPDDFGVLSVRIVGEADPAVAAVALARYGWLDGRRHAWLSVDGLRELAEANTEAEQWVRGFESMLDVAADHGWLGPDRAEVRAHIEWM